MSTELTYQMEPELRFGLPRPARVKAQTRVELFGYPEVHARKDTDL